MFRDPVRLADGCGCLNHISELPYVSRPMKIRQSIERRRCEAFDTMRRGSIDLSNEVSGECRHISKVLSEGRKVDSCHVQSIVEIASESFLGNQCVEIAVRCRK